MLFAPSVKVVGTAYLKLFIRKVYRQVGNHTHTKHLAYFTRETSL